MRRTAADGLGHVLGADRDRAAVGHRVTRVDAEIQDRQLQLAGVDLDRPQVVGERHLDLDVAAKRAVEHLPHSAQVRP